MKKEYLKLLRKLKKQIKKSKDCNEKEWFILAIDTYIKTIKNDEITDEEFKEWLLNNLKENVNESINN